MKLLALDTTTEACSAAVLVDGEIRAVRSRLAPRRHAELILPYCSAVLAEAGLHLRDLDAIACSRGPGAFTGVRIGLSVAQGIAFAAGLAVVPVSTLAALAHGAWRRHRAKRLAVAIDARMGEVYWACYHADPGQGVEPIGDEQLGAPEQVLVPAAGAAAWAGVGSGWARHAEALVARLPVASCWPQCYPDAEDVALLAARCGLTAALPPEQLQPVYLRDRVAQRPGQSRSEPNVS